MLAEIPNWLKNIIIEFTEIVVEIGMQLILFINPMMDVNWLINNIKGKLFFDSP